MWMMRRLGIAATIIGLVPIALLALAFTISAVSGCSINEGGMPPCLHFGIDLAGIIKQLLLVGVSTAIFAVPPAAALAVVWIVLELIHLLRGSPSA